MSKESLETTINLKTQVLPFLKTSSFSQTRTSCFTQDERVIFVGGSGGGNIYAIDTDHMQLIGNFILDLYGLRMWLYGF